MTNKSILFAFLLVSILTASCDLFKPAQDTNNEKVYKDEKELGEIQGKRVYNPETGEWETKQEVTTKIDTVEWVDLPPNKFPPITSDGEYTDIPNPIGEEGTAANGSVLKGTYDVTLLLPFNTQYTSETSLDKRSKWATNFYAGSKMALDALREENVNLRVEVLDTRGNESRVNNYLATNTAVQSADVVIGPYLRKNINRVADWAKKNDKILISPFSASMNLVRQNPNYIQINPSIKAHARALMNHALDNYSENDMLIVARNDNSERQLAEFMQEARRERRNMGQVDTTKIVDYIVNSESADFNEIEIADYINVGGTTVILVPSYKSEPFVYALLRKLYIAKKPGDRIVVYGLPSWKNFERIDFDYYENLNVHISAGTFVDNQDPNVRLFKQKYFDTYATPPTDEAVLGYDVTLFTGRMLKKYGTKFQLNLEEEGAMPYLQSKLDFERIVLNPSFDDNDLQRIDQFENKFVHILKFDNYYFQPAD